LSSTFVVGMSSTIEPRTADVIVRTVIELLETDGYDAVNLREVARRAHVSLDTIYKVFPTRYQKSMRTRDELIVTAIEQWMTTNAYADLAPPDPDESLYDGFMRMLRYVFEPWERSPRMLEAFHRARSGPGRARIRLQGTSAVAPIGLAVLEGRDPSYMHDVGLILTHLVDAVIAKFADGQLDITDILPTLERAVFRLTTNNKPAAAPLRQRRERRPDGMGVRATGAT
jgi:TetR/AcrR family transcriptional regulator, cholesterol catabolism regulator